MATITIYPLTVLGDAAFDGAGSIWSDPTTGLMAYSGAYFDGDGEDYAYANLPRTPAAVDATSVTIYFEYMTSGDFDGTLHYTLNANGITGPGLGRVQGGIADLPPVEFPSIGSWSRTLTATDYSDTSLTDVLNRLAFGDGPSNENPPRITFHNGRNIGIISARVILEFPDPDPDPLCAYDLLPSAFATEGSSNPVVVGTNPLGDSSDSTYVELDGNDSTMHWIPPLSTDYTTRLNAITYNVVTTVSDPAGSSVDSFLRSSESDYIVALQPYDGSQRLTVPAGTRVLTQHTVLQSHLVAEGTSYAELADEMTRGLELVVRAYAPFIGYSGMPTVRVHRAWLTIDHVCFDGSDDDPLTPPDDDLTPPDIGVLKLKIEEGSGADKWLRMG